MLARYHKPGAVASAAVSSAVACGPRMVWLCYWIFLVSLRGPVCDIGVIGMEPYVAGYGTAFSENLLKKKKKTDYKEEKNQKLGQRETKRAKERVKQSEPNMALPKMGKTIPTPPKRMSQNRPLRKTRKTHWDNQSYVGVPGQKKTPPARSGLKIKALRGTLRSLPLPISLGLPFFRHRLDLFRVLFRDA